MSLGDQLHKAIPWGVESGVRSLVATGLCGVGLIAVWWGVAGEGVFARQVGWLSAGIAILMVSLYAHVSSITVGRRAVGKRRAELLDNALVDVLPLMSGRQPRPPRVGTAVCDSEVALVEGLTLIHAPGCPMTAGRRLVKMTDIEAAARGLNTCGICSQVGTPSVLVERGRGE
jgi:hypothetical protein